jgi:HEAT repeats/Putative zinc-finger
MSTGAHNPPAAPCAEFERRLTLYAWQELEPPEREAVEHHVSGCAGCAATVARERALLEQLSTLEPAEPADFFVAQCRRSLARRLDRAEASARFWKRVRGTFEPAGWLVAHPAWTIAALVLAGFFAGRYFAPGAAPDVIRQDSAVGEPVAPASLSNSSITGVQRLPGGAVALRMTAEQPYVVQGSPEDSDIRGALLAALQGSGTADPDARIDSVDLLRPSRSNASVRQALCQAALRDPNPSVRLKAVEALRGLEGEADVRQALLAALEHDANPGVRVEAVSALRSFLETEPAGDWKSDSAVLRVLRDREHKDPNEFVRLESSAAMRQISARNVQ